MKKKKPENNKDTCKICGGIGDIKSIPLIEVGEEPSIEPVCSACRKDLFPEYEEDLKSDLEWMLELRERNELLKNWNTNLDDRATRLQKEVLLLRQALRVSVMAITVTDMDKMSEDYYQLEPISRANKDRDRNKTQ